MEGSMKYKRITFENRKSLVNLNVGSVSVMTLALLLQIISPIHSSSVRDESLISKQPSSTGVTDFSPDDGYSDYPGGVRLEDYPIVVPKRAALIFDRILKGLQSASENNPFVNDWSPVTRRGNNKDKLYFRCYFNAVSCYKK